MTFTYTITSCPFLNTASTEEKDTICSRLHSAVQVNDSLVYPHLVAVPRLGALPTQCLPGSDLEDLGRHTDRTLHLQRGLLHSADQITTHCTECNISNILTLK